MYIVTLNIHYRIYRLFIRICKLERDVPILKFIQANFLRKNKKESLLLEQLIFFVPLGATSLLVAATHSLFNAGLARLADPDIYIAAFAVAKSFMNVFQSAVAMIPQTVTALVKDSTTYNKVRRFIYLDALGITIVLGLFTFSGLARWTIQHAMGLNEEVLEQSVVILGVLILFPATVTMRNFYQGITIKFRMTPLVTLSTVVRIVYVTLFIWIIQWLAKLIPAGILAGIMFLGAGFIESLILYLGTRWTIKDPRIQLDKENYKDTGAVPQPFTTGVIMRFFWPLVLTSLIATLTGPIINASLGRTLQPEMIISAYAIAWGLGFIINSPLVMFHQVPLNFIDEDNPATINTVKRFGVALGLFSGVALLLVAFTPAGMYILTKWIGATPATGEMAMDVLRFMCLLPGLMVIREYYWGILMKRHMTKMIGRGKIVSLAALTCAIVLLSFFSLPNPAVIGAIGMVAAESGEIIYLYYNLKKANTLRTAGAAPSVQGIIERNY